MKLQRIIIASSDHVAINETCSDTETLYFDDLKEFMLIQSRLELSRTTVCWWCDNQDDITLLKHIHNDLSHWLILSEKLNSDTVDFLFNAGTHSILPTTTPVEIVKFHLKKLEKNIWKSLNSFDPYEGVCYLFGTKVEGLTKKEIQLLKLFLQKDDHKIIKDEVVRAIWKDILVNSKTLDVHFYNLRRKLAPYDIKIKLMRRGEWQLQL